MNDSKDEPELIGKLEELRNFLHLSVIAKTFVWEDKNNNGSWSKLWTSFDNIHDTQQAIERYKQGGTGKLGIYGLLQAMSVQQDAIKHLEQSVGLTATKLIDMPELRQLRDVRDETTGHPTNTRRARNNSQYTDGTITYTSMWTSENNLGESSKLSYYVWSVNGADKKSIDLDEAIKSQAIRLTEIIVKVTKELKKKEAAHISKFKGKKMTDIFNQTNYYFSKLYSFEQSREYSRICFKTLEKQYNEFKEGIKKRYGESALSDSQAVPGIYEDCKKIDELMSRIGNSIMLGDDTDVFAFDIFVGAAAQSFEQLAIYAKETDDRFAIK